MRRLWQIAIVMVLGVMCSACSVTRNLSDGEYLVQRVTVVSDNETPRQQRFTYETFEEYVRQMPNKKFLGANFYVWVYNKANPEKDNWWNRLKRRIGEEPVLLDMSLTEKSAKNLKTYMDSRGYYRSSVQYDIDTTRRSRRAYVKYKIKQGEPYYIDNFSYDCRDKELEPIIAADTANALVGQGDIFDITLLEKERTRIARYLNDRGYFDFSVNNIVYFVDTLEGDGTAEVRLIIRPNVTGYNDRGDAIMGNNHIYRIGEINVVPNYNPTVSRTEQDRTMLDTVYYGGLNIITDGKLNVRPKILHESLPLTINTLYNATQVERAYNDLMSLGYFKSARIYFEQMPQALGEEPLMANYAGESGEPFTPKKFDDIEEGLLRCYVLCSPTLRQSVNVELEGSTTSSFFGISATAGYQNRNIFRGMETFNADVTFGYEYMKAPNAVKRRANELGFSVGLSFPRFITPFRVSTRNINMPRTKVEASFNHQDRPYYRRDLSRVTWTYSWQSLNGRYFYQLRPLDFNWISVGYINEEFFNSLQNEYLRQSYRTQAILGLSASYVYNNQNKNMGGSATLLRINFESAGNLLNLIGVSFMDKSVEGRYNLFGTPYSQYVRGDISISRKIVLGEKTALAGRIFAGVGVPYGNSTALPFDRMFYVGGSNSMRGWAPRTLGPGNTPAQDTAYPVQMGDMRLEANLEFRFPIWGMFHGATFLDLGNVWYLGGSKADVPSDGVFHFDNFYNQLGFNTGIGLRMDIEFAILRLDWGIQLHNPNRPEGDRWISNLRWRNTSLNFGVGYPF